MAAADDPQNPPALRSSDGESVVVADAIAGP
jgi:hypothetical protein